MDHLQTHGALVATPVGMFKKAARDLATSPASQVKHTSGKIKHNVVFSTAVYSNRADFSSVCNIIMCK